MHPAQQAILIAFIFAFGASVGSFLNVVVWRLPRIDPGDDAGFLKSIYRTLAGLSSPPSHCPKCRHPLAWYDNIPVFGWLFLRGRCRYCSVPISARYPIVEFITGALFVFYYVMFFVLHVSPCAPQSGVVTDPLFGTQSVTPRGMTTIFNDWPIYVLYMFLVASLLAVSLIDAELYIIPLSMPWLMALVGMAAHAFIDGPSVPGAVMVRDTSGMSAAMAAGGAVGLALSIALFHRGVIPQSFPEGEPALEVDEALLVGERERASAEGRDPNALEYQAPPKYTPAMIRSEIRKEILFLLPPLLLALGFVALTQYVPAIRDAWRELLRQHWLAGMLGSVLGALVGALVVWVARIFGTLAFGRVAMGLGDVHLMFGAGAIVGAGAATVAFFLAPFAGILVGAYALFTRKKHELPYGPYLSLATGLVLLFYCPIEAYLSPGLAGLGQAMRQLVGSR